MARTLLWLYGIDGIQKIALRDVDALIAEDRFADLQTLNFTVAADSDRVPYLLPDTLVRDGVRVYRITQLTQIRDGGIPRVDVQCEARWIDLARRSRIGATSILAKTNVAGLTTILNGTGWSVGTVPADVVLYSLDDLDATVLSLVRRWAAITGTEVVFDTLALTVSLTRRQGVSNGIGFRYGSNLVGITRRYAPPNATRLYPFGANNLTISGVNSGVDYVEDYSWYLAQGLTLAQAQANYRKDQIWLDDRYLLAINLYDAAILRIAALAQPTISYECQVLDLFSLTGAGVAVAIGDTVFVRDSTFNLDLSTRVVRVKRYRNAPWLDEVELSFLQSTISDSGLAVATRTVDYSKLAVLVGQNDAAPTVASSNTPWATIAYTIAGTSNVVMGATFKGTATGTGTVRFSLIDNGVTQIGATYDFAFVAGQVEFSWPQFATALTEGTHSFAWMARVVSGSGTIATVAGECRAWILTQGAVGSGISTSPNTIVEESLALYLLGISDSYLVEVMTVIDVGVSAAATGVTYTLLVPTTSGSVSASAASGITVTDIPSS